MKQSLVSVIIPVFNSRNTIVRCINSVINQSVPVYEIIVIDDGSTDNSVELILQLKASKSISNLFLIQQINSGPSAARNAGILLAKGEYIAFLDSDDWWLENKIERQLDFFENDNKLGMVGTKCCIEKQVANHSNEFKEISFKRLLFANCFSTPSVVIRRELLNEFSFNNKKKFSEDYQLWLSISNQNKAILCFDELTVLGKPRVGSTGLSSNLWAMEKGELDNYFRLMLEKKISFILWCLVSVYSFFKYIRRLFIVKLSILAFLEIK